MSEETTALEKREQVNERAQAIMALMSGESVENIQECARAVLAAGNDYSPKHIQTHEQAFITMLAGLEYGLGPIASINQIYVVNGRPTMMGAAQLALINASGIGYYEWGHCDEKSATIIGYRRHPNGTWPDRGQEFTYTIEEAQNAGLFRNAVWKQYPADMLRWKAGTRMGRFLFNDILMGLYEPDEAGVPLRQEGGSVIVDVEALVEDGAIGFPSLADGERAKIDAQFEVPGDGPDFESAPTTASKLEEPEETEEDLIRGQVGAVAAKLAPPEDGMPPNWVLDDPPCDTKTEVAGLMGRIGGEWDDEEDTLIPGPLGGNLGKTVYIYVEAQDDVTGNPDVWDTVKSAWLAGLLPALAYEALCAREGVEIGENPFAPVGADAEAPDDEEDAFSGRE